MPTKIQKVAEKQPEVRSIINFFKPKPVQNEDTMKLDDLLKSTPPSPMPKKTVWNNHLKQAQFIETESAKA